MPLPIVGLGIGNIALLVGAGIIGSVASSDGRVSEFFSKASKVVFKHIQQDDSQSTKKSQNDSMKAQIGQLRKDLYTFSGSGPAITIINTRGSRSYRVPVFVVVGGVVLYGYIWWKGWKISDMMFASRRSLADASKVVGQSIEKVHSSIAVARRMLSSKLDTVNTNIEESKQITADTLSEVSTLKMDVKDFDNNVGDVQDAVQKLEAQLSRLQEKQDIATRGIMLLNDFADLSIRGSRRTKEQKTIDASTSPAILKLKGATTTPRTMSLPPIAALEPPSPSSSVTSKTGFGNKPPITPSGLKGLQDFSNEAGPSIVGGSDVPQVSEPSNSSSSSRFGWRSFLSRSTSNAT